MKTCIVGDIHGDTEGLLLLLEKVGAIEPVTWGGGIYRKPDWHLIQVGDLIHGGREEEDDLECLKVGLEVFDHILVGNHELPFMFPGAYLPSFGGQGRPLPETKSLLKQAYRDGKYVVSLNVDDWLVTHAGLHADFQAVSCRNAKSAAEYIRSEFKDRIDGFKKSALFDSVGRSRGGMAPVGGIFWCDWLELVDGGKGNFDQIVGHTPQDGHPEMHLFNGFGGEHKLFINVDVGARLSGKVACVWREEPFGLWQPIVVSGSKKRSAA